VPGYNCTRHPDNGTIRIIIAPIIPILGTGAPWYGYRYSGRYLPGIQVKCQHRDLRVLCTCRDLPGGKRTFCLRIPRVFIPGYRYPGYPVPGVPGYLALNGRANPEAQKNFFDLPEDCSMVPIARYQYAYAYPGTMYAYRGVPL